MARPKLEGDFSREKYHVAKLWQIAFFALNNTATNIFLFGMGFVTYYAAGIAGLAVMTVSTILALMRVFDSITDPIIGFIIDRTETKLGKFRPIMVIGNLILLTAFLLMFNVLHLFPENMQMMVFIVLQFIYIIGYTMQTTVTRAAQTVLTNHPRQRPLFSIFDAVFTLSLFTFGQVYASQYLMGRYGDFTYGYFVELSLTFAAVSALFTVLAVIAIWGKDRKEFYGIEEVNVRTRFRDYWPVLKRNRALQMLVLSAATDKFAAMFMNQQVVQVMFFGILMGNFALSGQFGLIVLVPSLIFIFFGVRYAQNLGLRRALVLFSYIGAISFSILFILMVLFDPEEFALGNWGVLSIAFLILYSAGRAISSLTPSIVIPMIADVSDYETYSSGRYIPGMISALFSFVDKLVSSLTPFVIGALVALIGFGDEFPTVTDEMTTGIFWVAMITALGFPIAGWVISIIAMRFYPLTKEKMAEVQEELNKTKNFILDARDKKRAEAAADPGRGIEEGSEDDDSRR
ncbi:MFS transporter [Salinicoccus halitifaciens]|uniref:Na+/melibiose symporter-like transporter n=1 Tax=Salinicoccus halitifaciens TaxID=1073415 RepID=A0ABV2E7Z9_9STAP|nr:MFS transporter [Salinicoccus halitifaciens]MCD2136397.1 MFS transporter [Salinicoccus halitifaciens]